MPLSKKILMTAAVASLSLLAVSAHLAKTTPRPDETALAIEIALKNPFYIPASADGKGLSAVVRTPLAENVAEHEALSAVRLVPRMEGNKVKVTVTGLIGNTTDITTCSQWNSLKSIDIGTYVAGLGEEVSLVKLHEHGARFENGNLTFKVVPKRVFALNPQVGISPVGGGGGCECAGCGRLQCCPYPGQCMGCGSCGLACCSSN